MTVLRRNLVPLTVLEPWVARLAAGAATRRAATTATRSSPAATPRRSCGRCTCSCRSGPQPPEVRSDLLLVVLVDALRRPTRYLDLALTNGPTCG